MQVSQIAVGVQLQVLGEQDEQAIVLFFNCYCL
jgi:hypothetical protein